LAYNTKMPVEDYYKDKEKELINLVSIQKNEISSLNAKQQISEDSDGAIEDGNSFQDPMKIYLSEIRKKGLLKSGEEENLSKKLELYLEIERDLGSLESINIDLVTEWFKRARRGFLQAKKSLLILTNYHKIELKLNELKFEEIAENAELRKIIDAPFSEDFERYASERNELKFEEIAEGIKVISVLCRIIPPKLFKKIDEKKWSLLSEDEFNDIYQHFEALVQEGKESIKNLTESNLRLVISIAKKYSNRGLNIADLVQEGNIGLLKAIKKFNYRKGFKFSTYATWWIRQGITRSLADKSRTIRMPVHLVEALNKVKRAERQLSQGLKHAPTIEDLSVASGLSESKIKKVLSASVQPISLSTPLGEEESGSTIGHIIEDKTNASPLDIAAESATRQEITKLLNNLTLKESLVIQLRFGLSDGKSRTLGEIGGMLGLTRERIRQIEKRAISKLRNIDGTEQLRELLI